MSKTTDKDSTNMLSHRGSRVRIPLPAPRFSQINIENVISMQKVAKVHHCN